MRHRAALLGVIILALAATALVGSRYFVDGHTQYGPATGYFTVAATWDLDTTVATTRGSDGRAYRAGTVAAVAYGDTFLVTVFQNGVADSMTWTGILFPDRPVLFTGSADSVRYETYEGAGGTAEVASTIMHKWH